MSLPDVVASPVGIPGVLVSSARKPTGLIARCDADAMLRSRTHASWVLSCVLAILLSACGGDSDGTAGEKLTTDGTQAETRAPANSEIVGAVEVGPEDLPGKYGSTNRFGELGDLVEGYVTLDMCGAAFASEDLRTARHQVGYSAPDGDAVSTETVSYETGGAELAMSELRDAVADCPKGFVVSNVGEQPAIKERIEALPEEADWQEDTLAMRITLTPQQQPGMSGALVYQRRDDVITAVYVWAGPERSAALATRFASLLSARLTAAAAPVGTNS